MNSFKEFKPNYIAEYAYNLCVLMNSFYQNNHISNLEDEENLNDWVSVIKLANSIIKEILSLLMNIVLPVKIFIKLEMERLYMLQQVGILIMRTKLYICI